MGNATAGLQTSTLIEDATDTDELFDALLALIPNPDAAHGTGAMANPPRGSNHLDEMSPGAAAQLRAELLAAKTFANGATVPGA